jgi:hypothetical protein
VRLAYALYAAGLLVTLGGVTSTVASGMLALLLVIAGISIFVLGIVVEERQ